ncbi:15193_t:CDS:2, partial [Funneliformis geosporum]
NNSILFVEQLVTSKGDSMLSYYDLSTQPGFPHTRRIPKWFLILQENMLVDQGDRTTRHNYPHSNNHATEHRIRTVFSKLGKIVRLTMDTKNLWQQATITYSADSNFDNIKKGHGLFVLNDMVYNRKATYRNWAYVECHCLDYTEG